jgi:hypothetical protein
MKTDENENNFLLPNSAAADDDEDHDNDEDGGEGVGRFRIIQHVGAQHQIVLNNFMTERKVQCKVLTLKK